jgi:hypothetical protein
MDEQGDETMSKTAKWVIGILVAIVILQFMGPFLWQLIFPGTYAGGMTLAPHCVWCSAGVGRGGYGYGMHMPMMGYGYGGFGFFGMLFMWLIPLSILALIVLGIVWLMKQMTAKPS